MMLQHNFSSHSLKGVEGLPTEENELVGKQQIPPLALYVRTTEYLHIVLC